MLDVKFYEGDKSVPWTRSLLETEYDSNPYIIMMQDISADPENGITFRSLSVTNDQYPIGFQTDHQARAFLRMLEISYMVSGNALSAAVAHSATVIRCD